MTKEMRQHLVGLAVGAFLLLLGLVTKSDDGSLTLGGIALIAGVVVGLTSVVGIVRESVRSQP